MFLGIDLGTGSVKALLLGADGSIFRIASEEYAVRSPRPGRAESNPEDWWNATAKVVREVVEGKPGEVGAIGLSGQMHGVVSCDANGRSLRPAILWADTRAARKLEAYRRLDAETLRRLANPPAVGMAGPTLLWLRDEEPETYAAARWALQPKDWLRLKLTGEVATEPSDASATLLYDLEGDVWDRETISDLGLDGSLLAPIRRPADIAGTLKREAAEAFGIEAGTPVAVGAADTAAAIIGTGLGAPGAFQLTVGTGAQIVTLRNSFYPDRTGRTHLFRTAAFSGSGPPYYAMAAMQNAGLALEWVRRLFGVTWEEFYEEAFGVGVAPGSGGIAFVPHLGGERTPGFAPEARGAWSGLGLEHERGHLLQAALEGVAFSVREGLEALEDTTRCAPDALRLAGGGVSDERWRRMLASVLGKQLVLLPGDVSRNASALGAAISASLALGDPPTPIASDPDVTFEPESEASYEEAYARYLAAKRG
ncbi:MAG: xylulokinase [Rubrobacter sp.]